MVRSSPRATSSLRTCVRGYLGRSWGQTTLASARMLPPAKVRQSAPCHLLQLQRRSDAKKSIYQGCSQYY